MALLTAGSEDVVYFLESQTLGAAIELDDVGHRLQEVEAVGGGSGGGVLRDGQCPSVRVLELDLQRAVVLSILSLSISTPLL